MNKLLLIITLALFAVPAFAELKWEKFYGGSYSDLGRDVKPTPDGGYIVAGHTHSYGPGTPSYSNGYVVKTDSLGDTLWTRFYGSGASDDFCAVAQTSDSGYLLAGSTELIGVELRDVYVVKTNAQGDTLWTRTWGGADYENGFAVVATSDSGGLIVGNTKSFGAGFFDVYAIRVDGSGNTLWTRTYGWSGFDTGHGVAPTGDGGFIIVGYTNSYGDDDVLLVRINASGDTLWTRHPDAAPGTSDHGMSIRKTSDNGYIICGYAWISTYYDFFLMKTDSLGSILWKRSWGGSAYDYGNCAVPTSDGGYIVTGMTECFGAGGYDVWLIKTDAGGDSIWSRTYGGGNNDRGFVVEQTLDGGYIIAGGTGSYGSGGWDVYLIKTDGNGNVTIDENSKIRGFIEVRLKVTPNPFVTYTKVPGHEMERFVVYDISGRWAETSFGNRIGEGLPAGVYFLKPEAKNTKPVRIVKVR